MTVYNIKFTDSNVSPIEVDSKTVDSSRDVTLFGREKLEYGQQMNENLINLLENFACPEDSNNPGTPDLSKTIDTKLANPTIGQIWFNSSRKTLQVWTGNFWKLLSNESSYEANWGVIGHGEQIPKLISEDGYEYPYTECVWIVSPYETSGIVDYMVCDTDSSANVIMQYSVEGSPFMIDGYANFIIIGLKYNVNIGTKIDNLITPTPSPSASPILSPTPSPTPTPTSGVTPTPTPSVTPTVTPSPSYVAPITASLFISPSQGDPGLPGPGGSFTQLENVLQPGNNSERVKAIYVSIQNISGGTGGPYTVDFGNVGTNVTIVDTCPGTTGNITETKLRTYYNYTGAVSNPVRTNVLANQGQNSGDVVPYMKLTFAETDIDQIPLTYNLVNTLSFSGTITISDGLGNNTTLYIPSGNNGTVSGTQITDPNNGAGTYYDSYSVTGDPNCSIV